MKHIYLLLSIFFIQSFYVHAQVGINNENPDATLDVNGNVLVRKKLYLENPGTYSNTSNSKLLMIKNDGAIIKYDVANSAFGPLNYVQYLFSNTSSYGLDGGYNTKISAAKYTLAVHGFSFSRASDDNTNITPRKTSGSPKKDRTQYIEGHQFYAYESGGTWWIKGFVNNSQFHYTDSTVNVNIFMDVIIYRNNFITKIWNTPQTINMGKQAMGTAPLPTGF